MKDQLALFSDMIDWIIAHADQRPSLPEIAARAGYDTHHFQKQFKAYTGVTPKQMIDFINHSHARDLLLRQSATLDAAYQAGLSGQGRLHDLFVRIEGVSPGAVKTRGEGLQITYGWHHSCLGEVLIAITQRGICWTAFRVNVSRETALQRLHQHWPLAQFSQNQQATGPYARHMLSVWLGTASTTQPLPLDLYGTNMQIQTWQALLHIPNGWSVSYKAIAEAIDKPKASRAVGAAIGANPISLLIPCHRVIQASGIIHHYAWGSERKKAILGLEGVSNRE